MVGLYKDPEGEHIFKNTSTSVAGTTSNLNDTDSGLRRRVRELENEVKKKDVCLLC